MKKISFVLSGIALIVTIVAGSGLMTQQEQVAVRSETQLAQTIKWEDYGPY